MAGSIERVALLVHRRDRHPERRRYRIWAMAEAWKRLGLHVRVVRDVHELDESDLLVPHIDCSYVPWAYWRGIRRHPRAVNRALRDIRKRSVSPYLLSRDTDWDGPVIVKTDMNSGGFMDLEFGVWVEPRLVGEFRKRLAWHPLMQHRCLGWTRTLVDYPIFDHVSEVPRSAWTNPYIVVERFFEPDRDESGRYVLYMWIVGGSRGLGRTLVGEDRYLKNTSAQLGVFDTPPEEVIEVQERFGLDYGKIDFVMNGGIPRVLDINRTPTVTGDPLAGSYVDQCMPLARSLLEDVQKR